MGAFKDLEVLSLWLYCPGFLSLLHVLTSRFIHECLKLLGTLALSHCKLWISENNKMYLSFHDHSNFRCKVCFKTHEVTNGYLHSTKEYAFLILCWVSCVLQGRKIWDFLCSGRQISPPPPPPKIFAGAYARPGTGMDFGLAFMMPKPQTVNLACKRTVTRAGKYWWWFQEQICYFLRVFLEKFSSLSTRHSFKSTYKHKRRT